MKTDKIVYFLGAFFKEIHNSLVGEKVIIDGSQKLFLGKIIIVKSFSDTGYTHKRKTHLKYRLEIQRLIFVQRKIVPVSLNPCL